MAQRRTSSKRKSPTKRKPRTRKVDHTLNWVGCGLFVVAALAFFKLGIIGTFLANCFRLVIGDAYLVGAALVVLYGAWLIVSGKALRPTARLSWGAGSSRLAGWGSCRAGRWRPKVSMPTFSLQRGGCCKGILPCKQPPRESAGD